MNQELRVSVSATEAAVTAEWQRVQDVVGPLTDRRVPAELYVQDAELGAVQTTPTGRRFQPVVPARTRASFGSYFNAFAASYWRASVGTTHVRLHLAVDASAVLTVFRSDEQGRATAVEECVVEGGRSVQIEVPIAACVEGGLVWFDLRADRDPVHLLDAGWEVRDPIRHAEGLVLGMPTLGKPGPIAHNLQRIASAPALLRAVRRIVLIDQGDGTLADEPPVSAAMASMPGLVDIVRQPNIGGSGAYSRVMHEAVGTFDAGSVTLLDDDIELEPLSLLKAYEFGLRAVSPTIVGMQMFDTGHPTVLEAAAERIRRTSFWWTPAAPELAGVDVGAHGLRRVPSLHRHLAADYAGWWACQLPVSTIRAAGYAMPFFLKWDDVDYSLRAARIGVPTVSLPGAAVWHDTWRTKDDSRSWPAFFHARNRIIGALLHGTGCGVLLASFMLDLKQLLAMQHAAVDVRHDGYRAVLAGPQALGPALRSTLPELQRRIGQADEQRRHASASVPAAPDARVTSLAPTAAPTGSRLAAWTVVATIKHLLIPTSATPRQTRLSESRGRWWVVAQHDDVFVPTGDGEAYYRHRRDRARFRRALATSLGLHLRMRLRWSALTRSYRAASTELVSPEWWQQHFDSPHSD